MLTVFKPTKSGLSVFRKGTVLAEKSVAEVELDTAPHELLHRWLHNRLKRFLHFARASVEA